MRLTPNEIKIDVIHNCVLFGSRPYSNMCVWRLNTLGMGYEGSEGVGRLKAFFWKKLHKLFISMIKKIVKIA